MDHYFFEGGVLGNFQKQISSQEKLLKKFGVRGAMEKNWASTFYYSCHTFDVKNILVQAVASPPKRVMPHKMFPPPPPKKSDDMSLVFHNFTTQKHNEVLLGTFLIELKYQYLKKVITRTHEA